MDEYGKLRFLIGVSNFFFLLAHDYTFFFFDVKVILKYYSGLKKMVKLDIPALI